MTKAPVKASKGLTRRLTSSIIRVLGGISLLGFAVVLCVFLYAWMTRASVEVSFSHLIPTIIRATPQISKPPPLLGRDTEQPIPDARPMVDISRLPAPLQGKPDEVVDKVTVLWQAHQKASNSVWYCCYVISLEIAVKVSIDTTSTAHDESARCVYRCIQTCLNAIGYYDGEIDGDPARTRAAVMKFQKDNRLEADGKVGKSTWHAILTALAQENYGKMSEPLSVVRAFR